MNKPTIAIYGQAGRGKSATIREEANQLINAFPNHTLKMINDEADITNIIEINGINIGIESKGDSISCKPTSLSNFVVINCDNIICAWRSSGMTRYAVAEPHLNDGYELSGQAITARGSRTNTTSVNLRLVKLWHLSN